MQLLGSRCPPSPPLPIRDRECAAQEYGHAGGLLCWLGRESAHVRRAGHRPDLVDVNIDVLRRYPPCAEVALQSVAASPHGRVPGQCPQYLARAAGRKVTIQCHYLVPDAAVSTRWPAEVDAETDGGRCDPAISFVDLVAESVSGSFARGPYHGAVSHELAVGLDDHR